MQFATERIMNLRCPVCGKRTIGVFTVFLHWAGRGSNRVNRFRCTDCGAPLKCYFQLPLFMLCGVILQLLVTSGSPVRILIGSLLFSGIAFLFYPIRWDEDLRASPHSSLADGKPFDTPADQGWYKLESTILAGAAFFVCWSLLLHLTTWLGWGDLGLILFFPVLLLALAGAGLYTVVVYRVGRIHWMLRLLLDGSVLVLFRMLVLSH